MDLKQALGYTSKGLAFQAFDVPAEQLSPRRSLRRSQGRPSIGVLDGAVRRKGGPALAIEPRRRPWEEIRIP